MLPLLLGNQDISVQMGPEVKCAGEKLCRMRAKHTGVPEMQAGTVARGGQEECTWEQDLHVVTGVIQEFSCLPVVYTLYILDSIAQ